jgi:ABC-type Fe3+ transport system permease subunit
MSLSHIIVIVFMLITALIVWLEMNSRKNAEQKEEVPKKSDRQHCSTWNNPQL